MITVSFTTEYGGGGIQHSIGMNDYFTWLYNEFISISNMSSVQFCGLWPLGLIQRLLKISLFLSIIIFKYI